MDDRLASAVAHWGPRFTANGVLAAEFSRITSALERWDDWCSTWSGAARSHEDLGREALEQGRSLSAGEHLWRASVYYHFAKFVFVQDPAQMRAAHRHAVRCLTAALPHLNPPGERVEIPFDGTALVGVLRRPVRADRPAVVILVPGLDSTKEELRATEETFLVRGLATFSVDGPGQGEAEQTLPIRSDWEVPGAAIVDALCARDDIHPDRIGVWGVSLGGYYAPRIASGDDRIRACVALSGPYDFGAAWHSLPQLTRETFELRSGSTDEDEARRCAEALTLEGRAEAIAAPLLVVVGKQDRLFDWRTAARLADEAPRGEILLLPDGNHGCANIPDHHRHATADWMARQLT